MNDEPVFLTVDDVLALHVDQIREFGGSEGLRDQGGRRANGTVVTRHPGVGAGSANHVDGLERIRVWQVGRCDEALPWLPLRCMVSVWRVSLQPRFD
jgi:hypothetical protein